MTALDQRKTRLTFETADTVRERGKSRPVVIEAVTPYYCNVRLKGTRTVFPISYGAIYGAAAKIAAQQARAEKLAAKKARRK